MTPGAALRRMIEWAEAVVSPDNEDFRRDAGEARDTLARFDRAVEVERTVQMLDGHLCIGWCNPIPEGIKNGDRVTVLVLPAGPGEGEGRG